jgi:shikimate kinase
MEKQLYMLIGPKGAGKTHIGTLVARYTDIQFIRVEPIWLNLREGEEGWSKVEQIIDMTFETHQKVMIESLGAGEGFRRFYASLASKYPIKMIRVVANLTTCLWRVQNRDSADHIAVSDDRVVEYNKIAAQVSYDWALEITNNYPASEHDILAALGQL